MKKILSIALVALLAVSSVFAADFSGSASVGFGYNLDTKDYGFKNTDSTKIDITANYVTGIYPAPVEKSEETEEAPAPSIYAGIKAAFTIEENISNNGVSFAVKKNEVSEAYVAGENWKVSILGAADAPDFAKSSLDKYYDTDSKKAVATDVKLEAVAAPGVSVTYNGWTVTGGIAGATEETIAKNETLTNPELKDYVAVSQYWYFAGEFDPEKTTVTEDPNYYSAAEWKEFSKKKELTVVKTEVVGYEKADKKGITSGATMSVEEYEHKAYSYSYKGETAKYKKLDYSLSLATPEFTLGAFKVNAAAFLSDVSNPADDKVAPNAYLGLSDAAAALKVAYKDNFVNASVATDFTFGNIGSDKIDFNMDILAKASLAPVYVIPEVEEGEEPAEPELDHYIGTVEMYYAKSAQAQTILATNAEIKKAPTVANLISAKAAVKLDSFVNLPLSVAVTGRDILGAKVYGLEASTEISDVSASLKAEYGFVNADYAITGTASYAHDLFTAKASATYLSSMQLYATASVESGAIIPGAKLSLAYSPAKEDGLVTTNLLQKFGGEINATCLINF